jgi:hypothetical protein
MAIEKISVSIADLETKELLRAAYADITDLRTKLVALQTKLDADAGVTDTDYASTGALATQQLTL